MSSGGLALISYLQTNVLAADDPTVRNSKDFRQRYGTLDVHAQAKLLLADSSSGNQSVFVRAAWEEHQTRGYHEYEGILPMIYSCKSLLEKPYFCDDIIGDLKGAHGLTPPLVENSPRLIQEEKIQKLDLR